MPDRLSWDRREPITDAMVRYGLRDAFQIAIDSGKRDEATKLLCDVGADEETAERMIEILIPFTEAEKS